jgi:opacity protein-like surface antigen
MAMKTRRVIRRLVITSLLALLTPIVLFAPQAYAESYVGGQIGVTFPQSLSNVKLTQDGFGGLSASDLSLESSLMGGIKLGHFFSRARWLGIETELFYTTPHIKDQNITISGPGGSLPLGQASGEYNRILTWAPMNLVLRYHKTRLQPYIAIGPGIFFATRKDADGGTQSGTAIGLNSQVGVRYYITRSWTVFGEGKYNLARIGYTSKDSDPDAALGFRATYSAFIFSFGVSYHF